MSKWDNSPRLRDERKVIPIRELQARKFADKFLGDIFPHMNHDTRKRVAGVLSIFMTPPKKENP